MDCNHLGAHLLCVGGEDHSLRIPFLLALRGKGFRISAAGSGDSAPFRSVGIDYQRFHFGRFINPLLDWEAFRTISEIIGDVRPRLVQSFDTKPNLLVSLAVGSHRDIGIVTTINGLGWLHSSRSLLALTLRPAYRALHRLTDQSSAIVVFQNSDDQAYFMRHRMIKNRENLVIPGSGIDVDGFEQAMAAGPSATALRSALRLGDSEVVVTVTRMTRQKGIPTLLEAAALVQRRRPGVRFLLVGPRQTEGAFAVPEAEINRHSPYVLAIGPRSDVPALLRLADVFVFPTEYREGVPRALLEAALAACPIVTTQMPGCSDVICDGYNGFLVAPRAPEILAERIIDLLRDRENAQRMGARAAQHVRQEFNLALTTARYVEVYQKLLTRASPRRPPRSDSRSSSGALDRELNDFVDHTK
jgi:glycosyltransferase involved in cell wall biosynthesis